MTSALISLLLTSVLVAQGVALQTVAPKSVLPHEPAARFSGKWRVKFTMGGLEKNLIFVPKAGGVGSFVLLDTGPDDKPVPDPKPAVWSQLTNDRVSFSGEAELPIGTCCREVGTLIFKGRLSSNNSISGKVIFVTSVDEEESPNKLRSVIGIFTATRSPK